jgi:hypothetical protein
MRKRERERKRASERKRACVRARESRERAVCARGSVREGLLIGALFSLVTAAPDLKSICWRLVRALSCAGRERNLLPGNNSFCSVTASWAISGGTCTHTHTHTHTHKYLDVSVFVAHLELHGTP